MKYARRVKQKSPKDKQVIQVTYSHIIVIIVIVAFYVICQLYIILSFILKFKIVIFLTECHTFVIM